MVVSELIELLKKYPGDLPVCRSQWSEHVMLEEDDIEVEELCEERNDGWVASARPDKRSIPYLSFR